MISSAGTIILAKWRTRALTMSVCVLGLVAAPATAAEAPPFVRAPTVSTDSPLILAAMFHTTIQLPEGRGIAKALMELGVTAGDAAEAARLAASHLGEGQGGCTAKIEISRADNGQESLRRLVLSTAGDQTIIERRGEKLSLVPASAIRAIGLRIA